MGEHKLKVGHLLLADEVTEDEGLDLLSSPAGYVPGDYPLLTESQEMHLFADHEVGTMVNNFLEDHDPNWEEKTIIYEEDLLVRQSLDLNYTRDTKQSVYSVMPNVLPPVNTVHPPVPSLVSNEDYSGPFEFELHIAPQSVSKNPWVYSMGLNKLFVAISTAFPIEFKCKWPGKNMFVRATPVFSLAQHSQNLVTRCIVHSTPNESSNKNVPEYVWNHVMRCQNSNAVYQGSVDDNVHLSVVIPLETPATGTDCVRVLYMFVCKNSCPSGMNRKPVEVVFTLENEMGQVYGRHKLNVRVCSCPKRDKEKEERIRTQNGHSRPVPLPGKRKKIIDNKESETEVGYPVDTKEYTLSLTICGKHNLPLLLKSGYDLMAGDLAMHGPNENIKKCLDNLAEKRRRLENSS